MQEKKISQIPSWKLTYPQGIFQIDDFSIQLPFQWDMLGKKHPAHHPTLQPSPPLGMAPLGSADPSPRWSAGLTRNGWNWSGCLDGSWGQALVMRWCGNANQLIDQILQTFHHPGNYYWWLVVEPTHLKNMLVKLGSSSPGRGEHKKYLSCHHLVLMVGSEIRWSLTSWGW